MDSNTHSTGHSTGTPTGFPVVAELQGLVDQDLDGLADGALAERVMALRGLMDRLQGHWLADPLVDQALELGHQRPQPCWRAGRVAGRMGVRVHGGNLSSPHPNTSTNPKMWTTPRTDPTRPSIRGTPLARAGEPRGSSATVCSRATRMPGECMGPEPPTYGQASP